MPAIVVEPTKGWRKRDFDRMCEHCCVGRDVKILIVDGLHNTSSVRGLARACMEQTAYLIGGLLEPQDSVGQLLKLGDELWGDDHGWQFCNCLFSLVQVDVGHH